MPGLKEYLNRKLTGRETIMVLAAAAVLAGLGYLAYGVIAEKMLQAQMEAALPRLCSGIREERAALVKAIEAYKTQFGVYPPDHLLSHQPLQVDPVTNTLLYELVGVVLNRTNKNLQVGNLEPAEASYVINFFQCGGFKNCAQSPEGVKQFLTLQPLPTSQWHDDPDVFGLTFGLYSAELPPKLAWEFDISPWRYVSSAPTNNPGRFDLWIEVKTKRRTVTLGNWKAVD